MEDLKYIIDDSTIVELLGVQSFSTKESAILELVKNAFDANATELSIRITPQSIEIIDNGLGMNKKVFLNNWMHVGKSNKDYQTIDDNGKTRILAGSKGIGRFALARLGQTIIMRSLKKGYSAIEWKTDWKKNSLEEKELIKQNGTAFYIKELRDKWTENEVRKLATYLGRVYNDTAMIINLFYDTTNIAIPRLFIEPHLGRNFVSDISLKYLCANQLLQINIISDEFLPEAQKLCGNINIKNYSNNINIFSELINSVEFRDKDLDVLLKELGDFSAHFFFSINRSLKADEEKFYYKYTSLEDRYDSGIILYRNSFSISSYEGYKDWLELGKRTRISPAAATHPTGSWRVRENQISGFVSIDKKNNKNLKDLANRQGLDENDYYKLFISIILVGISEFERYRQSIIRLINKKNKEKTFFKKTNILDKLSKDPNKIATLSTEEVQELLDEIKHNKDEKEEWQQQTKENAERYRYDVRILNVLASSGLRATSIAHDLRNDRNTLADNYEYIVKALKDYNLWDELNAPDKTKYLYQNIPALLYKNKNVGTKIIQFMDSMLEEIEKRQFFAQQYNIKGLIENIIERWKNDYSWINFVINIDSTLEFYIPEDIINVIFDNLILNTVQQNEFSNAITIIISVEKNNELLSLTYKDCGVGLAKKYLSNPRRILEPHETTRSNGHGLGMWIVNNTVDMTGGTIREIMGSDGFFISFTIGKKL